MLLWTMVKVPLVSFLKAVVIKMGLIYLQLDFNFHLSLYTGFIDVYKSFKAVCE